MASDVPDDQGQSLLSQRTVFNLKETVRRLQTVGNRIEPTNLLVVAVERYQVDGNFYVETGQSENDQSHSYDITLSDGTHLIKCILAAKLNIDVQQNKLYAGCVIRLLDCKLHYNETSLKAESYLIVEDLDCLQIDVPHLQTDSVTFWPGASKHEKSNQPLAVSRECYLALWNDSDPYGDPWNNEVIPTKLPNRAIPSITNIGKVVEKWQKVRLQKPYPPILGRILSKARLHYYGKPSRLREKWPYQVYLEIADSTGCVSAVLWTRLAPKYFNSLQVGTVLLLENYDIKKRYSQHTRPVLHNPELKFLEAELSLNSSHPEAVIQLIRPTTIPNDFRLPNVNHQFLTRRQLRGTPDQLICDVCGIVTFVGRWQRTRNTKKGASRDSFWSWRWVHIMDHTSSKPIILQLYSTAQPHVHNQVRPCQLLVCTQMKVQHQFGRNSRSLQCLFLTTTNETQLHIDNHSASTYKNEIIISMLQSWRNSVVFKEALETSAVGGYYSYPALPTRFEDYEKQFSPDNVLKIVPIHSLQSELDDLHYREHKTFIVQGHITSVGIVKLQSHKEVSTTETELSTSESSMSESEEDIFSPIQTRMTRKRKLQDEFSENVPHRVLRNRTVEITTIRDLEQHLNKMNRKRSKASKEKQKQRQDETVSKEPAVDVPTDTDYRSVEIQEVYNIDEQWAFLKQNITVIGEHSICKETLPRRYSEDHARALEYMFGLQPSQIADDFRSLREKIEDIPIAQSVQEYYEITLLGLNRTSAVKTFFLPVRAEGDHRPESQNSDQYSILSVLATGILPPDKEDPTPEGKSTTRQTRRAGKAAKKSARSSREGNYQGDVMANMETVRDRRVIAVLEVYRCGNGEVEIILNRAYAAD